MTTTNERYRKAARLRRHLENEEMKKLADSLPLPSPDIMPLDKASIIRLCTVYLKLRKVYPKGIGSDCEEIEENNNGRKGFGSLLADALDGFAFVLAPDAKIIYISDSISTVIGQSMIEVMGHSFKDICHLDDVEEIDCVLNPDNDLKTKKLDADDDYMLERNFVLRLKCLLTRRNSGLTYDGYKVIHCAGYLKIKRVNNDHLLSSSADKYEVMGFLGYGYSIVTGPRNELYLSSYMFTFRSSLSLAITFADVNIVAISGYEPNQLVGKSLYQFIHAADCVNYRSDHIVLLDKKQVVTKYYRFLTKGGGYIWLQSYLTIVKTLKGKHCIAHVNYVISTDENPGLMCDVEQLPKSLKHKAISQKSERKPSVNGKRVKDMLSLRTMSWRRHVAGAEHVNNMNCSTENNMVAMDANILKNNVADILSNTNNFNPSMYPREKFPYISRSSSMCMTPCSSELNSSELVASRKRRSASIHDFSSFGNKQDENKLCFGVSNATLDNVNDAKKYFNSTMAVKEPLPQIKRTSTEENVLYSRRNSVDSIQSLNIDHEGGVPSCPSKITYPNSSMLQNSYHCDMPELEEISNSNDYFHPRNMQISPSHTDTQSFLYPNPIKIGQIFSRSQETSYFQEKLSIKKENMEASEPMDHMSNYFPLINNEEQPSNYLDNYAFMPSLANNSNQAATIQDQDDGRSPSFQPILPNEEYDLGKAIANFLSQNKDYNISNGILGSILTGGFTLANYPNGLAPMRNISINESSFDSASVTQSSSYGSECDSVSTSSPIYRDSCDMTAKFKVKTESVGNQDSFFNSSSEHEALDFVVSEI